MPLILSTFSSLHSVFEVLKNSEGRNFSLDLVILLKMDVISLIGTSTAENDTVLEIYFAAAEQMRVYYVATRMGNDLTTCRKDTKARGR
jgi:hypothetical protein